MQIPNRKENHLRTFNKETGLPSENIVKSIFVSFHISLVNNSINRVIRKIRSDVSFVQLNVPKTA